MKGLQISTYDISGGAARATYRLHEGLREMGHECRMPFTHKNAKECIIRDILRDGDGMKDADDSVGNSDAISKHQTPCF